MSRKITCALNPCPNYLTSTDIFQRYIDKTLHKPATYCYAPGPFYLPCIHTLAMAPPWVEQFSTSDLGLDCGACFEMRACDWKSQCTETQNWALSGVTIIFISNSGFVALCYSAFCSKN